MPVRQYPLGLRKAKPVAQGCGLRLVTLPKATSLDGKLGIVLVAPPVNTSRENIEVIKDVMCSVGQLFAAYQAFNETLDVTYVLPTTEAAVKFSIVAQSALLCTEFPDREGVSETEYSITGHVLFRGVRTGMVVHCGRLDASRVVASSFRTPGESIAISMQEEQASAQVMMRHTFKGPALDTAALLRPLIHQGQILLSDDAWQTIQAKSLRGIQACIFAFHCHPCLVAKGSRMRHSPWVTTVPPSPSRKTAGDVAWQARGGWLRRPGAAPGDPPHVSGAEGLPTSQVVALRGSWIQRGPGDGC